MFKHILNSLALTAWLYPLQAQQIPKGSPVSVKQLAEANNAFAARMFAQLHQKESKENIFYSPYSVSSAFALLFSGTAGESEKDIAKTFGWDKNTEAFSTAMAALAKSMTQTKSENSPTFAPANRVFVGNSRSVSAEYQKLLKDKYQSELEGLNFANATESAKKINTWVEQKTNHKIKDLVPPSLLTPLTVMVLVNAVYFLGDWELGFNPKETLAADFFVAPKQPKKDKPFFMNGYFGEENLRKMNHKFGYKQTADYETLEMPYKGGQISMLIVLPAQKSSLAEMVKKLNPQKLTEFGQNLDKNYEEAHISIPKWKLDYSVSLKTILQDMGLTSIFETLNFSRAIPNSSQNLSVSEVLHKAFVDVSEKGTEAAAATAIIVEGDSMVRHAPRRFSFVANRPFLYLIWDNASGTILFMGQLTNP